MGLLSSSQRHRLGVGLGAGLLIVLVLGGLLRPAGPWGRKLWPAEAIEPHVAASGLAVALAWMEVAGAGEVAESIAVRRSQDGGQTFFAVEHLAAPGERLSADPTLVYGHDGSLYLSWLGFRSHASIESEPYQMAIVVARARPGAAFESPQLLVEDRQTTYDKPWSSVDSQGTVHIVYRAAWGNRAGIHEGLIAKDGTRRTRVIVDEPGFAGALPVVCSDPDSPRSAVVYLRPERGLELRTTTPETVSDAELLTSAGEQVAHEGPSCVIADGQVFVSYGLSDGAWDSGRSPLLQRIAVVRRAVTGGALSRRQLEWPGQLLMHPQLVPAATGTSASLELVYLAGQREDDPAASLRLARLGPNQEVVTTQTLRDGLRLTSHREDRRWQGDYLGVARSGQRTVVAFVDNRGRRRAELLLTPP